MHFCYLDESGGAEPPDASRAATPVMVLLGLMVDAARVPALTRDFLALKRQHFPGLFTTGPALDHIKVEVKGSDLLHMTRDRSRDRRRQASRFRTELLDLTTAHGCHILGRVWVKEPGKSLDPDATYSYAVQDISRHFSQYLQWRASEGLLIADGRGHHRNVGTAHSIFTQKWRTAGDPYPSMAEVPLFAESNNHAGLQLADLLASSLVFPMAVAAYGVQGAGSVHSSPRYDEVRQSFGRQIRNLQYRYRDETGRWRGGLVVSDKAQHRPGSLLFGP
jgi:hypothetical protein